MKLSFCRFILLLLCACGLSACYGPKPVVVHQELRAPTTAQEPYTLVVTIENQGGGQGQAEIIARLRSKSTGETAAQSDQTVNLEAHETAQLVFELRPGAPGSYEAVVEAQYPPE